MSINFNGVSVSLAGLSPEAVAAAVSASASANSASQPADQPVNKPDDNAPKSEPLTHAQGAQKKRPKKLSPADYRRKLKRLEDRIAKGKEEHKNIWEDLKERDRLRRRLGMEPVSKAPKAEQTPVVETNKTEEVQVGEPKCHDCRVEKSKLQKSTGNESDVNELKKHDPLGFFTNHNPKVATPKEDNPKFYNFLGFMKIFGFGKQDNS